MDCHVPGGDAAGPTKLRKGILGRKCLECGRVTDRGPMERRPSVPTISSLDKLRDALGDYGQAACEGAEMRAIGIWLIVTKGDACSNPADVAQGSLKLLREKSFCETGLRLPSGALPTPILDRLGPDLQGEARKVVRETFVEWRAAGSPHLDYSCLRNTFKFFRGAILKTDKINSIMKESAA